jgi:hypothetical protein
MTNVSPDRSCPAGMLMVMRLSSTLSPLTYMPHNTQSHMTLVLALVLTHTMWTLYTWLRTGVFIPQANARSSQGM